MPTKLMPLVLVVLLLGILGVLVYYDPDPVVPTNLAGQESVGESGRGVAKDPLAETSDSVLPETSSGDLAEMATLRTAVPEDAAPAQAPPMGSLCGRLVGHDGTPRASAQLVVQTWQASEFASGQLVGPVGSGGRTDRLIRALVQTDADGCFDAQVLAGCIGSLSMADDHLVFAERRLFETTEAETNLGDLVVEVSARLVGIVQDPAGNPIANVRLESQRGGMEFDVHSSATTGEDGSFSVGKLTSGTWFLRAVSSNYLPSVKEFTVESEEQRTGLIIVLKPGRAIFGRVVDDRGVGVPGMQIAKRHDEVIGGLEILKFSADPEAVTDAQGNFKISGLEGDAVTLRATGIGHSTATARNVPVNTQNLAMKVERLGSIAGVLVSSDGKPIAGSSVSWSGQEAKGGGAIAGALGLAQTVSATSATTNEVGQFLLQGVNPGLVIVEAQGVTHQIAKLGGVRVMAAQQVQGVRLIAETGAVARVKVVDGDGVALAGAYVSIARDIKSSSSSGMSFEVSSSRSEGGSTMFESTPRVSRFETGDDGVATITGWPGCDAVISAWHEDYGSSSRQSLALPATGSVEGTIVLMDPGHVDVTVTFLDGRAAVGKHVVLQPVSDPDNKSTEQVTTDAQGHARIGPIVAGEYRVGVALAGGSIQFGQSDVGQSDVGQSVVFAGQEASLIQSTAKPVWVRAGEVTSVELQFPVLTRITGSVIGVDGPVSGCVVELKSESDPDEMNFGGLGGSQQTTGSDGTFAFEDVESGAYIVRYGKANQVVKAQVDLDVPANVPELHRELSLRTGSVRVLVLSKDQAEPVRRAEVTLHRSSESGEESGRQREVMVVSVSITGGGGEETRIMTNGPDSVLTDEDGVAIFEDVPIGEYTLRVKDGKHTPAEKAGVAVAERLLTDCGTVELVASGQLKGVVTNQDDKRVMALVELRTEGASEWGQREMAVFGNYRITGLAPGRYEVRARAVVPSAGQPSEPVTIEVMASETTVCDLKVPQK